MRGGSPMAIEIKSKKTDAQEQMAVLYDKMMCSVVNAMVAKRNLLRYAAEIRALEGFNETATSAQKKHIDDMEAAAEFINIPNYEILAKAR